jgi:predicted transcriptional regulator
VFTPVQKLKSAGICVKETGTILQGIYYHLYSAADMETFKAEIEMRIKTYKKSLGYVIENSKAISRMHLVIYQKYCIVN